MGVRSGSNHDKPADREGRKQFYDWLAATIKIDGIEPAVCAGCNFGCSARLLPYSILIFYVKPAHRILR